MQLVRAGSKEVVPVESSGMLVIFHPFRLLTCADHRRCPPVYRAGDPRSYWLRIVVVGVGGFASLLVVDPQSWWMFKDSEMTPTAKSFGLEYEATHPSAHPLSATA